MAEPAAGVDVLRKAFKSAEEGDWETLSQFYIREPTTRVNFSGDTVLQVAALHGHSLIVDRLLRLNLPENSLKCQNSRGETALHYAVGAGKVEMARAMVEREEVLLSIRDQMGRTPFYWAAMYGRKEMLLYLASVNKKEIGLRRTSNGSTILHAAILSGFYDLALEIVRLYPHLAHSRSESGVKPLHHLVFNPMSFRSGSIYSFQYLSSSRFTLMDLLAILVYLCIPMDDYMVTDSGMREDIENPSVENPSCMARFHDVQNAARASFCRLIKKWKTCWTSGIKWLAHVWPVFRKIYNAKQKHRWSLQLVRCLTTSESQWNFIDIVEFKDVAPIPDIGSEPKFGGRSIPLISAIRRGNVEVVEEILKAFPEAFSYESSEAASILHTAIEWRQENIFKLLTSTKAATTNMVYLSGSNGNTVMHIAGKRAEHWPKHIQAAPHRLMYELIWFQRVKQITPPYILALVNSDGKTAKEVFEETHAELAQEAEKWAKEIANTVMVVATFMAALNFAAIFTAPGGTDGQSGLPVLLKKREFTHFTWYIGLALFCSISSLAIALSAYLSRFQQQEFYIALPFKFLLATTYLFGAAVFTILGFLQAYVIVTARAIPWFIYIILSLGILSTGSLSPIINGMVGAIQLSAFHFSSFFIR